MVNCLRLLKQLFQTPSAPYLMMVGMISAVKRMQRDAVAWEEKSPRTENTVMAASLRS